METLTGKLASVEHAYAVQQLRLDASAKQLLALQQRLSVGEAELTKALTPTKQAAPVAVKAAKVGAYCTVARVTGRDLFAVGWYY